MTTETVTLSLKMLEALSLVDKFGGKEELEKLANGRGYIKASKPVFSDIIQVLVTDDGEQWVSLKVLYQYESLANLLVETDKRSVLEWGPLFRTRMELVKKILRDEIKNMGIDSIDLTSDKMWNELEKILGEDEDD